VRHRDIVQAKREMSNQDYVGFMKSRFLPITM
jgi:hypothetical protein